MPFMETQANSLMMSSVMMSSVMMSSFPINGAEDLEEKFLRGCSILWTIKVK